MPSKFSRTFFTVIFVGAALLANINMLEAKADQTNQIDQTNQTDQIDNYIALCQKKSAEGSLTEQQRESCRQLIEIKREIDQNNAALELLQGTQQQSQELEQIYRDAASPGR